MYTMPHVKKKIFNYGAGSCAYLFLSKNTIYVFPILFILLCYFFEKKKEGRIVTKVYVDTVNINR